jgi:hypothetical protein
MPHPDVPGWSCKGCHDNTRTPGAYPLCTRCTPLCPSQVFCPRCEDIYYPRNEYQCAVDGAYFGTTFPHLLLLTYPQYRPPRNTPTYVPRVFGFKLHPTAYTHHLAGGGSGGAVGGGGGGNNGNTGAHHRCDESEAIPRSTAMHKAFLLHCYLRHCHAMICGWVDCGWGAEGEYIWFQAAVGCASASAHDRVPTGCTRTHARTHTHIRQGAHTRQGAGLHVMLVYACRAMSALVYVLCCCSCPL